VPNQDKIIKFFHGPEESIDSKIADGTISGADIVITSNTDSIFYVDADKTKHKLGGGDTETTQEHKVQLGSGGSIGGLNTGDTIPEKTSLDELIKMLTQKAVHPTYNAPGVTCRVSSGTAAGSYEVGTEINTTIQGVFTQNDAGALTSIEIKKGGSSVLSSPTSPVTTEAQVFTLGEETVTFNAVATYADGPVKDNNLGQQDATGQIKAGSKTSGNVSFTGKRNLFYGTGVGAAPEMTSEVVRGLANKQLGPANGTSFNINVATGQQYVVIAYPATLRALTKCFYVEQNTDLAANFDQQTISVQGANGAAGADYKVYVLGLDVPAAAPLTLQVQI
jgi:hypothetical protein